MVPHIKSSRNHHTAQPPSLSASKQHIMSLPARVKVTTELVCTSASSGGVTSRRATTPARARRRRSSTRRVGMTSRAVRSRPRTRATSVKVKPGDVLNVNVYLEPVCGLKCPGEYAWSRRRVYLCVVLGAFGELSLSMLIRLC